MRITAPLLVASFLFPGAALAEAPIVRPFANIGVGFGKLRSSSLITTQAPGGEDAPVDSGSAGCCPDGGLGVDLRLGAAFFGAAAIEGGIVGQGWSIGNGDSRGGAGFVGGGLRLYTLGLIELFTDPIGLPVELSLGVMFGYTIVGKDFAYEGSFTGFDATLDYKIVDFLSIGIRGYLFNPSYNSFVYTDYADNIGRCLDSSGRHPTDLAVHTKGSESCGGKGPSATFLGGQLVTTFHINVL